MRVMLIKPNYQKEVLIYFALQPASETNWILKADLRMHLQKTELAPLALL